MTQDMNHTFVKALRAVFVATMMSLTGSHALAQVTVNGNVYGGGNKANVGKNVEVNISGANNKVEGDVYGGGAEAHTNTDNWNPSYPEVAVTVGENVVAGLYIRTGSEGSYVYTEVTAKDAKAVANTTYCRKDYGQGDWATGGTTTTSGVTTTTYKTVVNMNGGRVEGDVYGGGLGTSTTAAYVCGDATVTMNGTQMVKATNDDGSLKAGRLFGANNVNGTPKGHVKVLVQKTVAGPSGQDIDVVAVFGGGNQANYAPANDTDFAEVEINKGSNDKLVVGQVFGGGNLAGVEASTQVTIVSGDVKNGVYGGSNTSGTVTKNATVCVTGGTIGTDANNKANIHGGGLGQPTIVKGDVTVNIGAKVGSTLSGSATIWGDVYGGSALGNVNSEDEANKVTDDTSGKQTYPVTNVNLYGCMAFNGDLYGGGLGDNTSGSEVAANVYGPVTVTVEGGKANRVFGANNKKGAPQMDVTVNVKGTAATTAADTYAINDVYGGGNLANYDGTPVVSVSGSSFVQNVFGGGNQATVANSDVTISTTANTTETTNSRIDNVFGGGNNAGTSGTGNTSVSMTSGFVQTAVYGGNNASGTVGGTATVTVTGGIVGVGSDTVDDGVFGGGYGQDTGVTGNVTVNIGSYDATAVSPATPITGTAEIRGDVYGGSAKGDVNKPETTTTTSKTTSTTVNLYAGKVEGNVYGGGLGVKEVEADPSQNIQAVTGIEAHVYGDVNVNLNQHDGTCEIGGGVFGCNNANGSPDGHVTVHVYKTYKAGITKDESKTTLQERLQSVSTYDLTAVYGGGNQADYKPTKTNDFAEVIIDGCDNVTIREVYGGGYGAATPATQVKVKGSYLINEVFGGGYGAGDNNPGANVGYYTYTDESDKTAYDNQNGKAEVMLYGGQVYTVYGGSNTKGNIRGGTSVGRQTDSSVTCGLEVQNMYGAGKNADMDAGTMLTIGCIPGLKNVYGGARDANIKGGVTLVINGGDFENVFGGNDHSGTIQGPIKLYIEETCDKLTINNLYLGGNLAAYSVYGYKLEDDELVPRKHATDGTVATGTTAPGTSGKYADPELHVTSFTHIDNVFGGGYGETAKIYGNPQIFINQVPGDFANLIDANNDNRADNDPTLLGSIGNVFGGGDQATVIGHPSINIGTALKVAMMTDDGNEHNVKGVNITGNVYGGGNAADVEGDVTVTVGTVDLTSKTETDGMKGTLIGGSVFGGGLGETTTVTGSVQVNVGCNTGTTQSPNYVGYATIAHDVYGGSAKGKVNATKGANFATNNNDIAATTGNMTTEVNLYGGTVTGSVYGGGYGKDPVNPTDDTFNADVYGAVTVNVYGGEAANVFGANNEAGTPKNDIDVEIKGGTITSVFGGGNLADYKPTAEQTVEVEIDGANASVGSVYGGGNQAGMGDTGSNGVKASTQVTIAAGNVSTGVYGGSNTSGTVTKDATVIVTGGIVGSQTNFEAANQMKANVHGGGYGAETVVSGDVTVTIGANNNGTTSGSAEIWGDVYGGSAMGKVNGTTTASSSTVKTDVNLYGGTIYGNAYGGGLGEDNTGTENDHAADVYGNVTVTVEGIAMRVTKNSDGSFTTGQVFGSNNVLGSPKGTVTVKVEKTTAYTPGTSETYTYNTYNVGEVYGGGKDAAFTGTSTEVQIMGSTTNTKVENVFGGGLGSTATVNGTTAVTMSNGTVGNVYGGGSAADVTGKVSVALSGGTVDNDVYGGGALAHTNTTDNTIVTNEGTTTYPTSISLTGVTVNGSVYGGGKGREASGSGENAIAAVAALTKGDVLVTMSNGTVKQGVYGGSNINGIAEKSITVTISGGTVGTEWTTRPESSAMPRMVFGGGKGQPTLVQGSVTVNVGETGQTEGGATIWGDVYGGSALGNVNATSTESVLALTAGEGISTAVNLNAGEVKGDVYGGGLGQSSPAIAANVYGPVTVAVSGGSAANVFGANNVNGAPMGIVTVNISGGEITNVYGGGNAAAYTAPTATPNYPVVTLTSGTIGVNAYGGGLGSTATVTGNPQVNLAGATVTGKVFGGGSEAPVVGNPIVAVSGGSAANVYGGGDAALVTGNTTVTTTGGTVSQDLYGGGNLANVTGDVTVNIQGGTVTGDVYGGGAKAHTNTANWNDASGTWADSGITTTTESGVTTKTTTHKTIVNLTGGTIGNAYGGGLGAAGYPAYVYGDVEVKLGSETTPATATAFIYATEKIGAGDDAEEVTTKGRLFGCNNVNGSPKGNVTVTVRKTQGVDGEGNLIEKVAADNKGSRYDLEAVYGGGNMAAYIPADPTTQRTKVDIYGCEDTSIRYVYGGGNSAPVPSTEVTVYSAYDLGYTFGGGNGSEKMWNGSAYVESPGADVGIIDRNAYNADHTTGTYGTGNAHSCLKGGTIHSTFGGSNTKGTIAGNTIPDILPDASQNCPLTIVNVYGGGKSADVDGDVDFTVSCLVDNITNVYGGSYDANIKGNVNLTVTSGVLNKVFGGNDHGGRIDGKIVVNIEEVDNCKPIKIKELYGGGNYADYPGKNFLTDTWFEKVKSGGQNYPPSVTVNVKSCTWIRNIYGGGSDANVYGDVEVNIDMVKGWWAGKTYSPSYGAAFDLFDGNEPGSGDPEAIPNAIGKIGNVYGGGKNGNIYYSDRTNKTQGTVTVNIGTLREISFATAPSHLTANANGKYDVEGAHIYGDIYGGGYGSETSVDGKVTVNLGATDIDRYTPQVDGDVYGGSALGKVDDTEVNLVKVSTRNVFGGGKGQLASGTLEAISASVTGTSTVNMQGATVANIYGGCNYNGTSGNTALNIYGGQIGEGTLDLTATPKVFTRTTKGNVFGGGYGKDTYVEGNVIVNIGENNNQTADGAVIFGDVYGGGALGHVNGVANAEGTIPITATTNATTTVNLNKGTIYGDAYGGGLGDATNAAYVGGAVNVIQNEVAYIIDHYTDDPNTTDDESTLVNSGRIFGCNNLNGYPLGDVTVTVNKTVAGNVSRTDGSIKVDGYGKVLLDDTEHYKSTYEVAAVYGGGNLAHYEAERKNTHVIINGCDETSIETVYGGGNAAAVPEAKVDINGTYEIGAVFGGGNGKDKYKSDAGWVTNPGANVNGPTTTWIYGGTVHEAYGASNEKGTITGSVFIDIGTSTSTSSCKLDVGKVVGAGKNADVNGNIITILGCKPSEEIPIYYGGADNANVNGNVELTITSGNFGQVYGGNNLGGSIMGHIKLNIEETGNCATPIRIDKLYLGGNRAAYSRYGYYVETEGDYGLPNETAKLKNGRLNFLPRVSANDLHKPVKTYDGEAKTWTVYSETDVFTPYDQPVLNVISATSIGQVFGGGYGVGGDMYADPTVNINMIPGSHASEIKRNGTENAHDLGEIGDVFGGGDAAAVYGNTTINIGTASKVEMTSLAKVDAVEGDPEYDANATVQQKVYQKKTVEGAYITGNVYGGGNLANVSGNTYVNICAKKSGNDYIPVAEGASKVTIGGNVFGGGQGLADNFYCDKAMVGIEGAGADKVNYPNGYPDGNTSVIIGNGTVNGSVYGGGEVGRVEMNTTVTIGLPDGGTSSPDIKGDVFGGGKGEKEHGYAALVRGNPTVTIQANAKVEHNVYGGGEIASVARYKVPLDDADLADAHSEGYTDAVIGRPYALKDAKSGFCTVTVKGNAVIGPDTPLKMYHADSNGNISAADAPDDAGHVFGAGKGIMPENYDYDDNQVGHKPRCRANDDSWTWFGDVDEYIAFIQTLALSSQTTVTIGDDTDSNCKPFIKGSVYGGSENGLVQFNTNVYIKSGQIGWGKHAQDNAQGAYGDDVWADNYTPSETIDLECPHWDYGLDTNGDNKKDLFAPYDPYANAEGVGDVGKYPVVAGQTEGKSTEGGRKVASDGHTFYGNVFGGGSGSVPYFDTKEGISKYLNSAGTVKGNTNVTISGGHILTNVYGGCEATNVLGKATIKMTKGTIGVPRTKNQIIEHPVTCYLFGAGKGDQRIFFNKDTNVDGVDIEVTGGRIYGSVFGGGEDGHVMRDVKVTIGQEGGNGPKIGTLGSTYVDGNVFGGGRGFGGEALTAGNVGGTIDLIINGGEMLGSVYGGGRLASVGYGLYLVDEEVGGVKPYGVMRPDNVDDKGNTVDNFKRGYITVTVNGGTIGKEFADDAEGEHSGNVFGGSMGRLTKLDGTPFDAANHWALLATAKSTEVNINGGTIKRSVYGGGEMGTVTTNATVNVSGGTIGTSGKGGAEFGNVYGGGKGYVDPAGSNYVTAGIIKGNTTVAVSGTPQILHNVYGGGAYGSVGEFNYDATTGMPTSRKENTTGGIATITITGGTIGTDGKENGMIFGSSRGDVGAPGSIHDKLAWVYDANVTIGTSGQGTTLTTPLVKGSVYGSGENGHTFNDAKVTVHSGTIGITDTSVDDGAAYTYRGNVYGGGCGTDKYDSNNDDVVDSYNPLAGVVYGNATVTIDGGQVVRNVYGAGSMGSVGKTVTTGDVSKTTGGLATISISGGQIGVDGTAGDGNVFGAARGDAEATSNEFALVRKETSVSVTGGNVMGNVYGGGELGCVGTYTMSSDMRTFTWQDTEGATNTAGNSKNTGVCNVTINGSSAVVKGNVFGAGKGKDDTFWCEKGIAYSTDVSVINGTVNGNVYGGGEVGRVETDAEVKIGIAQGEGKSEPTINGSVFGGGAGVETHGYSALVRGNTTVTIDQYAHVGHSVYGGGEIASVGKYGLDDQKMPSILQGGGYCYVTVKGNAAIADDVYGAGKGVTPHFNKDNTDPSERSRRMTLKNGWESLAGDARFDWDYFQTESDYSTYLETLALATHPEVTIDESANISGSVFGGGELGLTKGSVIVTIKGGTIAEDVYGGGSLANTNTTSTVDLDGDGVTETVHPTTKVSLLGGLIKGDAYGGGLGDLAARGTGHSDVAAMVYGDVFVTLGNETEDATAATATAFRTTYVTDDKGAQVVNSGRVFGCNNLNGSPKGNVTVTVNRTVTGKDAAGNDLVRTVLTRDAQNKVTNAATPHVYEVAAVYGGGNLANYEPVAGKKPMVRLNTCDISIEEVYGGGNAAMVPETDVLILGAHEIENVFGGGNGEDKYTLNGTDWITNPGANVGTSTNPGNTNTLIKGGYIHEAYGASNSKGTIFGDVMIDTGTTDAAHAACPVQVEKLVAAGKDADVNGDLKVILGCKDAIKIPIVYGGADNANVNGNVELTITSGHFGQVFGGNNLGGAIRGHIILNIEETSECEPIRIDELYLGGNQASYSKFGYYIKTTTSEGENAAGKGAPDETPELKNDKLVFMPRKSKDDPHYPVDTYNHETKEWTVITDKNNYPEYADPVMNLISCTEATEVFGGGFGEGGDMYANPTVNINMIPGYHAKKIDRDGNDVADNDEHALGIIGNVYGGGNLATVVGDPTINIGTADEVTVKSKIYDPTTKVYTEGTAIVEGANITGNVYGGGNKADIIGDTHVNICAKEVTNSETNTTSWQSVTYGTGLAGVSIDKKANGTDDSGGSVFGGGCSADVLGNTFVRVSGGYVFNGVFGGGYAGSVGKFTRSKEAADTDIFGHTAHEGECIGKPVSCEAGTGKCTVVVDGGQIGPITVATLGMNRPKAQGGPVPQGWVWGGGQGIIEDPEKHPDTHFKSYVGSTDVTIGGTAFIMESIIGGGEFGRVLGNTLVKIQDHCQIGVGEGMVDANNKPIRYTEAQFIDPTTTEVTTSNALKECSHFDYGFDHDGDGKLDYLPYDPYYEDYPDYVAAHPDFSPASTSHPSDGKTWIGCVFAGGSGYMPYKKEDGTGYDWCPSAGWVEGNTELIISGGHILTNVYGGNEYTNVKGKSIVTMTGGTIGVPRTVEQIQKNPLICYLFGAGRGDQRTHFNKETNVGDVEVKVTGGIIYGSVFGGGEDGHVLGDVNLTVEKGADFTIGSTTYTNGPIIGTWGTSYVDGNVFGGGRGFSGEAQTAGTVGGNVKVNISGGKMLGNIYGGGRLASVGTMFTAPDDPNYGNFVEDGGGKTYGHVAVNISGGIIGNTVGNAESGNVFGGSMGRLTLIDGTTINPIWPKMAQVKETNVTISGNAVIKRTVYGGGELGTVRDNATVNINGGTVYRDVYGAGYGSKDYETKTKIEVKVPKEGVTNPTSASDYDDVSYVFTPMIFAGCVGQNTYVNIAGGQVKKSVYGGGEMASVGIMDCRVKIDNNATDPVYTEGTDKYVYDHFHSHLDENNGFALSWPFHFENAPGYFGATHVNITGGRIGLNGEDNKEENNPFEDLDNGDVYGGGKGIAGEYKNYVYCANVGSAEVTIAYPAGNTATPSNYMESNFIECIAGAVYGGAENGHVMGDTKLTLKNGLIGHSMYGGGSGKGKFSTTLLKIGSTSEHYTRDIYSFTAGKVFGNSTVEMSGGTVVRNVYGGGNMGSVGKGNYAGGADDYSTSGYGETLTGNLWDNANDYSKAFLGSGKCTVNITGGTIGYIDESDPSNSMYPWNSTASLPYGNVFGGCRGESAPNIAETPRYLYSPEFFVGYANETAVTIGKTDGSGPTILGSVYGGGQDGHVRRDASVTILGGEIGIPFTEANKTKVKTSDPNNLQWLARGNVYGSGSGIGKYKYDFDYDGKYESTVKYNNGRATVDTKEEDYSTSAGSVTRFTTVDIKGGTIHRNVYGGGSLSSIGAPKIGQSYDPYHPGDSDHSSEVGKQSLNKVTISGGQIGDADCLTSGYGGDVNGGSRGAMAFENSLANPASFANSVYTEVTISDDADVKGNVFGGGEAGIVKHDTEVKMQGGTVGNDLYGGGDLADVGGNTTVLLTGGTITNAAYGGARGTTDIAAKVGGDVLVDLNNVAESAKGCVVDMVFGANNVNGTPEGHVKVHVHGTQNKATAAINAKVDGDYDVVGVFGGGNAADYIPDATKDTQQSTEVIIEGCELTSIKEVYGGGFGAATPGTNVLVKGTKIIDNVFGGGYGAGTNNPGANVGYRTGGTTSYGLSVDDSNYKTAVVRLMAGHVNNVYGGSNSKGNIRGGSSITNLTNTGEGLPSTCSSLDVVNVYGGGKNAEMEGGAEIILGCMPDDWIEEIYAGAENADVGSDVMLTITSGKFGRVFGGNKTSGRLHGSITVNIEENPDCDVPIIIGELYGGGNEAPYSIYGYKDEKDENGKWIPREKSDYDAMTNAQKMKEGIASGPHNSPQVNVRAFTSIGNIFGGGYGTAAVMVGSPTVNINEVILPKADGTPATNGYDPDADSKKPALIDGTNVKLYKHEAGKMGVIGTVFGGGNAAPVIGDTHVNIGTTAEEPFESLRQADGSVPKKSVVGADIRGNVYGGGNNAEVEGKTDVVIGQKKD